MMEYQGFGGNPSRSQPGRFLVAYEAPCLINTVDLQIALRKSYLFTAFIIEVENRFYHKIEISMQDSENFAENVYR
jgi:hypothetical protein